MNEQMQQWVLAQLTEGKDFILAQAPDVLQQFLAYTVFSHSLGLVIMLALTAGAAAVAIQGRRLHPTDTSWGKEKTEFMMCFGWGLAAVFTAVSLVVLKDLVHVAVFPKAYLLSLVLK